LVPSIEFDCLGTVLLIPGRATPVALDLPRYLSWVFERKREISYIVFVIVDSIQSHPLPVALTLWNLCQIKSRGLLVGQLVNCDTYALLYLLALFASSGRVLLNSSFGSNDRTESVRSVFDSSKSELVRYSRLDCRQRGPCQARVFRTHIRSHKPVVRRYWPSKPFSTSCIGPWDRT
jgi:hypothetical protein